MNQYSTKQKYEPTYNEIILGFVSGSAQVDSQNYELTSEIYPEYSKLLDIKYFQYKDLIESYSKLHHNWDSYNADSISNDSIITALEVLNFLYLKGFLSSGIEINIFPMREGGIQFEFDKENICAELEINKNGELTFIIFDNNGNIVDEIRQHFELLELSTLLEEAQYA